MMTVEVEAQDAEQSKRGRQITRHRDPTGLAVRSQLRAEMLADIGLDVNVLRRTVQTQIAALDACRKDGVTPHWAMRLRAAADLQALGVPREVHGNTTGTEGRVLVEFPDWFKALATRRGAHSLSGHQPEPSSQPRRIPSVLAGSEGIEPDAAGSHPQSIHTSAVTGGGWPEGSPPLVARREALAQPLTIEATSPRPSSPTSAEG